MVADAGRVHGVQKPPDERGRYRARPQVVQPAVLVRGPLQQVLAHVEPRADPVVERLDVGVGDLLRRALRHPGPGLLLPDQLGAAHRVLDVVLALEEVGEGKEEPAVGDEVIGDLVGLLVEGQVVAQKGEADAAAAIVGQEIEPRQPHDLADEVVDELRVVLQHVRVAVLGLVREAEAGEVEDGDEVVVLQEGNHLAEVEARRRVAVQEHQGRVGAVPEGPVENPHPTALVVGGRRGPFEVVAGAVPRLGEGGMEGEAGRLRADGGPARVALRVAVWTSDVDGARQHRTRSGELQERSSIHGWLPRRAFGGTWRHGNPAHRPSSP